MRSNLKKTLLATAAGVATLVGGHAVASADTVEVQTGDTLSGIAHANNTSTEDLAKANNITDQNLIIAGQKLTVSTPASSAASADARCSGWPRRSPPFRSSGSTSSWMVRRR